MSHRSPCPLSVIPQLPLSILPFLLPPPSSRFASLALFHPRLSPVFSTVIPIVIMSLSRSSVAVCLVVLLASYLVCSNALVAGSSDKFGASLRNGNGLGSRFEVLSTQAAAAVVSTSATNWTYYNVYDYGAVGDGKTDNTAAFQNAINAAAAAGGGTVLCNRGHFLFSGTLNLLQGVTLEGTYAAVPSHPMNGNVNLNTITGTLLMVTSGQGNVNAKPFITIQQDATVKGLVIYYPAQKPNTIPIPFPWTLDLVNNNAAVLDVECLNCWDFIRAVNAARHYIARVQGQPMNTGVYIDETYDIGRVENVHFNPWFTTDQTYMSWQLLNGRSFVIGRADWEYVFNTFAFGYAIGYHFIANTDGNCNGNFVGIGVDMATNASVQVDSAAPFGILIVNGEFTAFKDSGYGPLLPGQMPTQVLVTAGNTGTLRIVNSAFWGKLHRHTKMRYVHESVRPSLLDGMLTVPCARLCVC